MRRSAYSIGTTEECVIFQPCGFGVVQAIFGFPGEFSSAWHSTAIMSTSLPAGARIALPMSMSGHWPAYHFGTVVPYSLTRSMPQRNSPLLASQHMTWHFGPRVTTSW